MNLLMAGPADDRQESWLYLVGNHEQAMLEAFRGKRREVQDGWIRIGGDATMGSYETADGDGQLVVDMADIDPVLEFIDRMSITIEDDLRIFVHAGIRDIGRGNYTLTKQNATEMLWIKTKDMDARWPSRLKKFVVHGHTPFDPGVPGRRICLDGGAGRPGGHLVVAKFNNQQAAPIHLERL